MPARTTLERAVKRDVTKYLLTLQHEGYPLYFRMPVPGGYGRSGLDYEGCLAGLFFTIETKAPGEDMKPRQRMTGKQIVDAGGKVFVISCNDGLDAFKAWVEHCMKVKRCLDAYAGRAGK